MDSTGFPFTLVYPNSAHIGFPLNPLGITLDATDLSAEFLSAFSAGGAYAQYPEFAQCVTYGQQQDANSVQVAAPQDILAAELPAPEITSIQPQAAPTSHLAAGPTYYYCITAFSDNVIDNSGGTVGETLLSDYSSATPTAGQSVALTWSRYYDPNTAGYNVYRYASTNGQTPTTTSAYSLIAHLYGATTTSYVDMGAVPQAQQTSVATASNYGFNPLSEYYTDEIEAFFNHYTAPNSFVLRSNGAVWIGSTVRYTPTASWNATGATYTVLQLTAQNSPAGKQISQGDVLNIYEPLFATNTRFAVSGAPPMPSWLEAHFDPHESPAQMVFGCNAVFASDKFDPDIRTTDLRTAIASIENEIVSAYNRGLATSFDVVPDNWAAFPQMQSTPVVAVDANSQVTTATTYYYAVTAVNVYGETTPSLEVAATLGAGQSAMLNWFNGPNAAPATAYKIYRGTTPDQLTLLYTTASGQQTTYTDEGAAASAGAAPPHQYFTPGSTANWYAAIVQTNSLLDPASGVSINGLSYGFPFSDQGGVSTNLMFPIGAVPSDITVNLGSLCGPGFVTQSIPDAVASTAYSQTIVASGTGTGTTYTVIGSTLPHWLTLDPDTGVLSGMAPSTPTSSAYDFTIQVSNSSGVTAMPFHLNVAAAAATLPLNVIGLDNGSLQLPSADVVQSYTAPVRVTGGSGTYQMQLAPGTSLPTGINFGALGTQGLTSQNGVFTLTGVQTTVYNSPNVGFNVVISDVGTGPHAPAVTITLQIQVNPALAITTTSLPDPVVNQAYSCQLTTNSQAQGVQFSVPPGSLPPGMTLTAWGVLCGTPTQSRAFPFTVTATDAAGGTATQTFSEFAVDASAGDPLSFTTTTLPTTAPGSTFNQTLSTQHGVGAITFTLVNGALPTGLTLSSTTGQITGTVSASASGVADFTVRATDSRGDAAYQGFNLNIVSVANNTQRLAANATTLVIQGSGFDTGNPTQNVVTLSSGTVQSVTANTATQLTVTLASAPTVGALQATVSVDGLPSVTQQVATVVAASTPTVTASVSHLALNATTLAITGSNFDTDSADGTNVVTLSSGTVQSVSVVDASHLLVTISGGLAVGTLSATVTTNGVASANTPGGGRRGRLDAPRWT